ncbi:hypothetical protein BRC91_10520 [Halobacteriales archaeon QS_4_62_28]|nr:MAG: hypothetical protein BRC91_10520 [Halobacteriales archaeon QS_4_62_28]
MERERATVWGVVGLVVMTTLVSGPLVGAVDLTTEPEMSFGDGSVAVEDVALPDRATLSAGRFGAGEYTLRVPDASVEISAVQGRPLLVYRLSIQERGYTRSTVHFVSQKNAGTYSLSLSDDSFDRAAVANDSYQGRLEVIARTNERSRVITARQITVEVVE